MNRSNPSNSQQLLKASMMTLTEKQNDMKQNFWGPKTSVFAEDQRNFKKSNSVRLKKRNHTLYGVSIINLPSFETQGIVPCWKKVTYIKKRILQRKERTKNKQTNKPAGGGFTWKKKKRILIENKNKILTWSASRPKNLWLSKNLRVASSVNGLVIMYQCICTDPAEPAGIIIIECHIARVFSRLANTSKERETERALPSFVAWAASLWTHNIRSACSWKSDLADGSPISK
jgi:hypothetical protein